MVENEIGFLRARAFREKAPAIVRLEIRRLERMIGRFDQATSLHNTLVRARYELGRFVDELGELEELGPAESRTAIEEHCTPRLEAAILALSAARENAPTSPRDEAPSLDGDERPTEETLRYVLDRLRYVYDRLHLMYD